MKWIWCAMHTFLVDRIKLQEAPKRTMNGTHQSSPEHDLTEIIKRFGSTFLGKKKTRLVLFFMQNKLLHIHMKSPLYLWLCHLNWVRSGF